MLCSTLVQPYVTVAMPVLSCTTIACDDCVFSCLLVLVAMLKAVSLSVQWLGGDYRHKNNGSFCLIRL